MFRFALAFILVLPAFSQGKDGWIPMFDGKTLNGWKASERPENWKVEDGTITGRGERSHLFWMVSECVDCEFKAEVKLSKGGNSGMYVRAKFMEGWPEGYETQVNNSSKDPVKTGSLYEGPVSSTTKLFMSKVFDQLVPDDTWWTQHVIIKGTHIIVKVNEKVVVDYDEKSNTYKKGYCALQQHDASSVVQYRNLMFRPLSQTP